MIIALDHILIAMPAEPDCLAQARHFYGAVLGLMEQPKPASLRERGGAWFSNGVVMVHLGEEDAFIPAHKAHPAFAVVDIQRAVAHFATHGYSLEWDSRLLPDVQRFFVQDPFGNRLEFLQRS